MIDFIVPGTTVGKGRPRFVKRGNYTHTYTPEATASYENLVKVRAMEAMKGREPFSGPVSCRIELAVIPPASWSNKKQMAALAGELFPTTKPDLDNVLKLILDAMNEVVYKDDKQVCMVRVVKRYGVTALAQIVVMDMTEE